MTSGWFEMIARVGYFSRGIVYFIVAALAGLAAVGSTEPEGSEGALQTVINMPLGAVLLWAIAIGLLAHAAWRFAQSVLDADDHGLSVKSFFIRTGLFVSFVSHTLLAVFAARTAMGGGDSGGGDWTTKLMDQPYGFWLVAFVGACTLGAGITITVKGVTAGFSKWMDLEGRWLKWANPVCRFGLATRGLIMITSGCFVLLAAWRSNSGDAKGLADSLQWLQHQPFGLWMLAIAALGLLAFSCYSVTEAFYRDIRGIDEW